MDNDDKLIGRVLTRREALIVLGTVATAALAGCQPGETSPAATAVETPEAASSPVPTAEASTAAATVTTAPTEVAETVVTSTVLPTCVVRPELTEGPYFVDEGLDRSDIRSDPSTGLVKDGAPLQLVVRVSRIDGATCGVYPGVTVDVWHCDAEGMYSDVTDRSFDTRGQQWLRGSQTTDASGVAQFTTIYPGWYPGRAVHIHFKLRTDPEANVGREFTSQWFFDESLTDQVHAQEPYASKGYRTILNEQDGIFRQAGDQMIVEIVPDGDGYRAVFDVGLQSV